MCSEVGLKLNLRPKRKIQKRKFPKANCTECNFLQQQKETTQTGNYWDLAKQTVSFYIFGYDMVTKFDSLMNSAGTRKYLYGMLQSEKEQNNRYTSIV